MREILFQTHDIVKQFPGQLVLKEVNLSFGKASVHALVGENGAGKSTLVNILSGALQPTSGYFEFKGTRIEATTPQEAQAMGIGVVHQELNLIPRLTVAENQFLGQEIKNHIGKINWKETYRKARELLSGFEVGFDEKTRIETLSVADQQMVEIIKVVSTDAKLIFMDEPTAVLTERETVQLFKLVKELRKQGRTIVYISHRLNEVKEICDTISVLRDGTHIHTGPIEGLSTDQIVEMMVAHSVSEQYPYVEANPIGTALKVEGLKQGKRLKGISFEAKKGEILGVYGLVGAGRTELARAIIGADKKDEGLIELDGTPIDIKGPMDAIRNGVAYITESFRRRETTF